MAVAETRSFLLFLPAQARSLLATENLITSHLHSGEHSTFPPKQPLFILDVPLQAGGAHFPGVETEAQRGEITHRLESGLVRPKNGNNDVSFAGLLNYCKDRFGASGTFCRSVTCYRRSSSFVPSQEALSTALGFRTREGGSPAQGQRESKSILKRKKEPSQGKRCHKGLGHPDRVGGGTGWGAAGALPSTHRWQSS